MKQSILSQIHLRRQGRCPPVPGRFASPFLEVTGVASERLVFMVQKKCWFVRIWLSILSYEFIVLHGHMYIYIYI